MRIDRAIQYPNNVVNLSSRRRTPIQSSPSSNKSRSCLYHQIINIGILYPAFQYITEELLTCRFWLKPKWVPRSRILWVVKHDIYLPYGFYHHSPIQMMLILIEAFVQKNQQDRFGFLYWRYCSFHRELKRGLMAETIRFLEEFERAIQASQN